MCKFILALSLLFFLPFQASGKVLLGLIDQFGNPVHSADEFNITVQTRVNAVPQGFRYNYNLTNDSVSNQAVWNFKIFLQDIYSFIPATDLASFAWGPAGVPFIGSELSMSIRWAVVGHPSTPELLQPNMKLTGFSFVSPYPPGIIKAYAEGVTESPWYASAPGGYDAFDTVTPYGPGKVFPVIGPVKPTTPNVTDNYSVIGCAGGICDVQLDITGPQDPYGTAYTYLWSGAFGSAVGAKPLVQLAAGTYNISVAVSDPYATLVTATMPITVIDPNPPVVVPPVAGTVLTPAQVAALTPAELAALTPTQVSSIITLLSPAQIASLAPNQLIGLSPAQVQSVSTLLTPAQLSAASSMTDEDGSSDNSDGDSSDSNSDDESDEDDKSS